MERMKITVIYLFFNQRRETRKKLHRLTCSSRNILSLHSSQETSISMESLLLIPSWRNFHVVGVCKTLSTNAYNVGEGRNKERREYKEEEEEENVAPSSSWKIIIFARAQ